MKDKIRAFFKLIISYGLLLTIFLYYKSNESIFYLYTALSAMMYMTPIIISKILKHKKIKEYFETIKNISFAATVGFVIAFIFQVIDFNFGATMIIIITMLPFTVALLKFIGYINILRNKKLKQTNTNKHK